MLIGREDDQQALSRLLAGARVGESGVLVLSGEPGVGKTALLEHAVGLAGEMQVLRAFGSPRERNVAFAALHQLLRPALAVTLVGALPGPQSAALSSALALEEGGEVDRFAVGAGLLTLLSRYAENRPVLVVVDDVHLVDRPSAEALAFAARRLMADRVAVVLATRPEEDSPVADLPGLVLHGLDPHRSAELLAHTIGQPLPAESVDRLHRATGGNPLALLELAGDAADLDRLAPLTPVPVPEALHTAFTRRLDRLSAAERAVLLLAVVAEGDLAVVSRAAAALRVDPVELAAAEDAGLLALVAGRAEFRHPLLTASVQAAAPVRDLRRTHLAVAAALPEQDLDRRAWHRAEAAAGLDEQAADELAATGDRGRRRGAHAVAATAYERAGLLTADHELRVRRLLAAGECAWLAGQPRRAEEVLERAGRLTGSAEVRGRIEALRGSVAMQAGSVGRARTLLLDAAQTLSTSDVDAALDAYGDLVVACFYLADPLTGLQAAERTAQLLDRSTSDRATIRGRLSIGLARVMAGTDGIEDVRSAVDQLVSVPEISDDPLRPAWVVLGPLFLRESGGGRELVQRAISEVRARCALGQLPHLLFHTARDLATTNRWQAAVQGYREGIDLAREAGLTTDLAMCLAGLAWVRARTGDELACRAGAAEALALATVNQVHLATAWAQFALGELELSRGRADVAVGHLTALTELLRETGFRDVDLAPGPELAEALLRQGDTAQAAGVADDYHRRALAKGQPWALARAERALGLVSGATDRFERALVLHRDSPDDYECARTELAYGALLRRQKSRSAARPHLQAALRGFEALGAQPWADEAARELAATGASVVRQGDDPLGGLTPQERQIAGLLARGRTTREAAAALFLSPKTVEYHLRHVYTKLQIHSRAELADAVGDGLA